MQDPYFFSLNIARHKYVMRQPPPLTLKGTLHISTILWLALAEFRLNSTRRAIPRGSGGE